MGNDTQGMCVVCGAEFVIQGRGSKINLFQGVRAGDPLFDIVWKAERDRAGRRSIPCALESRTRARRRAGED
jgi:hypothetical protein